MTNTSGESVTSAQDGMLVRWAGGDRARVICSDGERLAFIPGRWRLKSKGAKPLAAGDRVVLEEVGGDWRVRELLPRRNEFTRKLPGPKPVPQTIAANLDRVIIVVAAAEPETAPGFVDRMLAVAAVGDVPVALLINKIDLLSPGAVERWTHLFGGAVPDVLQTSAVTGAGVDRLAELLAGKVTLLAGVSGVGKSTLINRVDPRLQIRTTDVSTATGKGRHMTTAVELHPLTSGGWVGDTPGLRECAPWGLTPESLVAAFPEIARVADRCKFRDCRHRGEAGCAVTGLVGSPELPPGRYLGYLKLLGGIQG